MIYNFFIRFIFMVKVTVNLKKAKKSYLAYWLLESPTFFADFPTDLGTGKGGGGVVIFHISLL